jgi:hypothetical protein
MKYVSPRGATIFIALTKTTECKPQRGANICDNIVAPLGLIFLVCITTTNIPAPLGLAFYFYLAFHFS